MTTSTPQDLVEHALTASTSSHCHAVVSVVTRANLRWANNTLTTNGETRECAVTIVAFDERADGVATASVSGSASTPEQVAALVERADAAAVSAGPAADAFPLVTGEAVPPASDWADPPVETSIGVYTDLASGLGEAFGRADAGGRVLYGFVDHELRTTYVGSSTGLRLRQVQPTGHYSCTGKTADLQRSAWVGGATEDFREVSALTMDDTLATRLAWGERQRALPAGRYDTVLPAGSVSDLLIYAYWSAGARIAYDGQSAFGRPGGGTRIGERLAAPSVEVFSDPRQPGLECAEQVVNTASGELTSVFDTGLPLGRTDWIRGGDLTGLIQTRQTAAMTDAAVTPFVDNLVVDAGGSGDLGDLIAGTENGLLVTCLWYIREVDAQSLLLTGLTRDGVYAIEGGEVTGLVNNFRFNESPLDLLRRFSHASATERSFSREWGDEYFNRTATPALRVPDFNMSSVSQAV